MNSMLQRTQCKTKNVRVVKSVKKTSAFSLIKQTSICKCGLERPAASVRSSRRFWNINHLEIHSEDRIDQI